MVVMYFIRLEVWKTDRDRKSERWGGGYREREREKERESTWFIFTEPKGRKGKYIKEMLVWCSV